MDSYLDVSWGHVLSCISQSKIPGLLHRWVNTPSLVKFQSVFDKTYQAQKCWKVPDPASDPYCGKLSPRESFQLTTTTSRSTQR
uniref:Exocyst complex subunit Exo70 C-terminal domain-containing protein n=1 Tax=Triticum urartu TaxID=4572 RepID=A0A8R7TP36_TRIUA